MEGGPCRLASSYGIIRSEILSLCVFVRGVCRKAYDVKFVFLDIHDSRCKR